MPSGLGAAVELRLGKIRTGQTQDLVSLAQFAIFALQNLDALALFAGRPRTLAGIGLMATNPAMQGLRGTANLRGNGLNGSPLGGVVVQVFQNHAHGTFTDFRGVGRSFSHGLIFSRVEASTKPGAIHTDLPEEYREYLWHTGRGLLISRRSQAGERGESRPKAPMSRESNSSKISNPKDFNKFISKNR